MATATTIAPGENPNRIGLKKAVILDGGGNNGDTTGARVLNAVVAGLRTRGFEAETVALRDKKIGNCAGDFFCWTRNPGICQTDDDNRVIAEMLIAADLMVYLTPVSFGGYSSILKRMVDHQLQNISPYFTTIRGETHHVKRYDQYPDFLLVGWMDAPDVQSESVFRYLFERNVINFYAEKALCGVVLSGQTDGEVLASVQGWLADLSSSSPSRVKTRESGGISSTAHVVAALGRSSTIQQALLLVGSPRTRQSTSNSLGQYLLDRLGAHTIKGDTVYLHTLGRSAERFNALMENMDRAGLVVLAFPLYIDSLPAPVIDILERIAAHRRSRPQARQPLFVAIANCGFPEAYHTRAALAICETFARQAAFAWAGSLGMGGGGMIDGRPLGELGGRGARTRRALELAAEELAKGQAVPGSAQYLLAKPAIPSWLYRLISGFGWKMQARRYGTKKPLSTRPYLVRGKLTSVNGIRRESESSSNLGRID